MEVSFTNVLYAKQISLVIVTCIIYNTFMFEIGEEIRKERKRRKISQEKIAKDLQMSRATISQIESGTIQEIGVRKLLRVMEYLGLEVRVRRAGTPPTLDELRGEK